MPGISTGSFFTRDTNSSLKTYAKAGLHSSYMIYDFFTLSFWHAGQPGTNKAIWSSWEDVTNNRSWLFSNQSDGSVRIILSSNGSGISANYKTTAPICDYSWRHYLFTFQQGSFFFYVDNVVQGLTATTPWTSGSSALFAGNVQLLVANQTPSAPILDQSAGGCYNNFAIFNKVLSVAERNELFNKGRPALITSQSFAASCTNWWRMDQTDTAPTLADSIVASAAMTITKTGTGALFDASANYPKLEDYPLPSTVLTGVVYNGSSQIGTYAAPTAQEIAAYIMDSSLVESNMYFRQSQKLVLAATAGKLSGAATTTVTIRNTADSKDRIVATVDASGNRTATTYDVT